MNNEIKLIAKFKETLVEKEKELEKFRKWQQDTAQSLYDKDKKIEKLQNQLQQKENIIKEIREKLLCYGETFDNKIHQQMQKELLEILDKGE